MFEAVIKDTFLKIVEQVGENSLIPFVNETKTLGAVDIAAKEKRRLADA